MDTTYRFRFLIYLAAFMLAMSLCFVYAEPLPAQNHLLFQTTPQHAGFLATDDTWAREYAAKGFRLMGYGIDQAMLQRALAAGLDVLHSAMPTTRTK